MIDGLKLTDAIVSITDDEDNILGTGFFISKNEVHRNNIIVTCAHCISDYKVNDELNVSLKLKDIKITMKAQIILKTDAEKEDVAILLFSPNEMDLKINGLELMNFEDVKDPTIQTYGYSDLSDYDSLAARGEISNPKYVHSNKNSQLYPKVEVEIEFSVPGFSGAPVWNSKSGRVIGIIQERVRIKDSDKTQEKVYLIPSKTILEVFNNLDNLSFDLDVFNFEKYKDLIKGFELNLRNNPSVVKSRIENGFVGRKEQLEKFLNQILDNNTIAVTGIQGMGGIGKTAITIEVCHIIMESWEKQPNFNKFNISDALKVKLSHGPFMKGGPFFEDGILWLEFKEEVGIVQVVQDIGNQIGIPIIDGNLEDRLMVLFHLLYKKKILIVLDSVEQNSTNFNYIFEGILQKLDCPVVITSRVDIPNVTMKIDVGVMEPDDAIELFRTQYSAGNPKITKTEHEHISTICKTVGYLPLAIKILASWGKANTEEINTILHSLMACENKLEFLKTNNPNSDDIKNQDAYLSFSLSYDDDRLDPILKTLFAFAGTFRYPFSKESLYNILPPDKKEKLEDNSLNRLCALSLVEKSIDEDDNVKYYLHPLMRDFALMKLRDNKEERAAFEGKKNIDLINLHKLRNLKDSNLNVLEIISTSFECIKYELYKDFFLFLDGLDEHLFYSGKWESKISLLRAGITAAEILNSDQRKLRYSISLADVLIRQDKKEEANKLFNESMKLAQALKNWGKYFFAYSKLFKTDDLTSEKWIDLLENLRSSYILDQSYSSRVISNKVGNIYDTYQFHKCEEALVAGSCKDWNRRTFNFVVDMLGLIGIEYEGKNYRKSIDYYIQLIELANQITGFEIKELIIYLYRNLINCYLSLNELTVAEKYLESFNLKSKELGLLSYAEDYSLLKGKLLLKQSKFDQAIECFNFLSQKINGFWTGRAYFEKGKIEEDKEQSKSHLANSRIYLEKALEEAEKEKNLIQEAEVLLWLIKLNFVQNENIRDCLNLFLKVKQIKNDPLFYFNHDDVYEEVEVLIVVHFGEIYVGEKEIEVNNPVFLNRDLPQSIMGKDKKVMNLVGQGMAVIGDGNIEYTKSSEILEDMDILFKPQIKKYANLYFTYAYYIDKFPVTNAEYALYCKRTGTGLPDDWDEFTLEKFPNYPVTNIPFDAANKYAIWSRKRIPTEIEWEKACRGDSGLLFPWGQDLNGSKVFDQKLYKILDSTISESEDINEIFEFVFGSKLYLDINLKVLGNKNYFTIEDNLQELIQKIKEIDYSESLDLNNWGKAFFEGIDGKHNYLILKLLAISTMGKNIKQAAISKLKNLNDDEYWKLITIILQPILKEISSLLNHELDQDDFKQILAKRKRAWLLTIQEQLGLPSGYAVNSYVENVSPYGVHDMVGNVLEMVDSEIRKDDMKAILLKGCMAGERKYAFNREILVIEKNDEISKNIGFRCVKPIFQKSDFEYFKKI